MDLDALVKALSAARGCGCCGVMDDLAALVPCGPACSADEDGWVDHTYGDGCSHNFPEAVRRLLTKVAEDARKETAPSYSGPHSRACGISRHLHGPDCHPNCPTCGGKA